MPYLSREERGAIERDGYAADAYRAAEREMAKLPASKRSAVLARHVATLRRALDAGDLHLVKDLGVKIGNYLAAKESIDFTENDKALQRARPDVLPETLPAGTAIAYGHLHGKSFASVAVLRHEKILNTMSMREEPAEHYCGKIGFRKACVPAGYIDWVEWVKRTAR